MHSVRDILDRLDAEALRRLLDLRSLPRARSLDEMASRLAKSYRGEVEQLLNDLLRKELLQVFRDDVEIAGGDYWLPNPPKYDHARLLKFARRALMFDQVPSDFIPVEIEETEEVDQQADDESGDSDSFVDGDATAAAFEGLTSEWSRPRKIGRLLRQLGLEVPVRLRTPRFHELLERLSDAGIEACVLDTGTVLTSLDESPGMAAKLRLRRRSEGGDQPREPAGPIRVIPSAPRREGKTRLPDWELALARLQFLTAVPSTTREHSTAWPHEYVRAACLGLSLEPPKMNLLNVVAASYSRGEHDPLDSMRRLVGTLSEPEWTELLGRFSELNADHAAIVAHIVEQIQQTLSGNPPPSQVVPKVSAPPREPSLVAAAAPENTEPKQNHRDLGKLSGMFD